MRDLLPAAASRMSLIEDVFKSTVRQHGYTEVRLPILEQTALFERGVGESTDAVSKEMFSFPDSSGASISMRPEGTASCVRAVIANNMTRGAKPRLWYAGSMFRHEQPQKGRYREFQQFGAEVFGYEGPDIDVELIEICEEVWLEIGISDHTRLHINTLGNAESRIAYRDALLAFLRPLQKELDPDSFRRLDTNPLRILDSKNDRTQELLQNAPSIADYLDEPSTTYYKKLLEALERSGISYEVNERLVRGLDYYTHIVFEWHSEKLGAQSQIGGGGRYDGLVERLGGPSCPASGFAVGVDRIALVHEAVHGESNENICDVYVISLIEGEDSYANDVCRSIRTGTGLRVRRHHGGGKIKNQFREADRSGAQWALVIGSEEISQQAVTLKYLRTGQPQQMVAKDCLITSLLEK